VLFFWSVGGFFVFAGVLVCFGSFVFLFFALPLVEQDPDGAVNAVPHLLPQGVWHGAPDVASAGTVSRVLLERLVEGLPF
jgi:hypothetical protein